MIGREVRRDLPIRSAQPAEAVPSFAESELWREYWQDYEAEPEPLDFLLVSAFVRHLSLRLASGHRDDMEAAMELTERLIADGESYVHNLAVVGILEDLQNSTLHSNGVSPSDFETASVRGRAGGGRRCTSSGLARSPASADPDGPVRRACPTRRRRGDCDERYPAEHRLAWLRVVCSPSYWTTPSVGPNAQSVRG
jgi:hypothetical protein